MNTTAIIVAAGAGRRLGAGLPKAFVRLCGRPMVLCSLSAFQRHPGVGEIVLVVPPGYVDRLEAWRRRYPKLSRIIAGGRERTDSVRAGLGALSPECRTVLVHDAARPLVSPGDISAVIAATARHGAAILAAPVADTVKLARGRKILKTVDRTGLWKAQTPQGFRRRLIEQAYARRGRATDDSLLLERAGVTVRLVPAKGENIKVTTTTDLEIATCLLLKKRRG